MKRKVLLLTVFLVAMSSVTTQVKADDNDLYLVYNASYTPNPGGARCMNMSTLRSLSFGTSKQRILKARYVDNHVDTISTTVIGYLYIGSVPLSVETTTSAANDAKISLSGNTLSIRVDKADAMSIYTTDGRQVAGAKLKDGLNTIDISGLPEGMYITRTASSTLKFCK